MRAQWNPNLEAGSLAEDGLERRAFVCHVSHPGIFEDNVPPIIFNAQRLGQVREEQLAVFLVLLRAYVAETDDMEQVGRFERPFEIQHMVFDDVYHDVFFGFAERFDCEGGEVFYE